MLPDEGLTPEESAERDRALELAAAALADVRAAVLLRRRAREVEAA